MAAGSRSASPASARAHHESVTESITSVTEFLVDLLGTRMTARLACVDPSSISRWKSGGVPKDEAEQRLRAAHQVAVLLLSADDIHTVRAWFIGMNPQLDDDAPIDVIASGNVKAVLAAARSFVDAA